jgi:hypothetical protein
MSMARSSGAVSRVTSHSQKRDAIQGNPLQVDNSVERA